MGNFHHLVVLMLLGAAAGQFFRESIVTLNPPHSAELAPETDFGFSLSYQESSQPYLVVGAPHASLEGHVYRCPLNKDINNDTRCERLNIDVKKLAPEYDKSRPEQPFCLGLSVAATPEFIISCAPLWTTTNVKKDCQSNGKCDSMEHASYGTCFVCYDNTNTSRYQGILEQYLKNTTTGTRFYSFYGGAGLSLLADSDNKLVLLGKPGVYGEIQYIQSTDPLAPAKSLFYSSDTKDLISNYTRSKIFDDFGYAFASGNFFDDYNGTEYAVSARDRNIQGRVFFLRYHKESNLLTLRKPDSASIEREIFPSDTGDMFGAAMDSADLNRDGFSDLLVGAPGFSPTDECFEAGAVYVFLGGDKSINDRRYGIFGDIAGSRFGTTISSSDLDGDSIKEIFVSAPFEDYHAGALYIFSGFELYNKFTTKFGPSDLKLSDFQFTQRIKKPAFKWSGLSLQPVVGAGDKGCSDLAVGSPGTSNVFLLSCIPAINVTLVARSAVQTMKQTDKEFKAEVCVYVSYPVKPDQITIKLKVTCHITSTGAKIKQPVFEVDLSKKPKIDCRNVEVEFGNDKVGVFFFLARIKPNNNFVAQETNFSSKAVRLSPEYSILVSNFTQLRACDDLETNCVPKLSMEILWAGRPIKAGDVHYVDSKTSENVTMRVRNAGGSAYDACVLVRIGGAQVHWAPCAFDDGAYTCNLPQPLGKHKQHDVNIPLNIDKASKIEDELLIEARLYNKCSSKNATQEEIRKIGLIFVNKNVYAVGHSHDLIVTDVQIADPNFQTIEDRLEYAITNNGSLTWERISATVSVQNKNISSNFTVSTVGKIECIYEPANSTLLPKIVFKCVRGKLPAHSTWKITINTVISKDRIAEYLKDHKIEIDSSIEVRMTSKREKGSRNYVFGKQKTTILYKKETYFGNNKPLIIFLAILSAVIILGVFAFVLYKVGFFKREEKERLDSLKKSVRSNRRSSHVTAPETPADDQRDGSKDDDEDIANIDIVEDFVFEPIPVTNDDAALFSKIETKSMSLDANEMIKSAEHKTGNSEEPTISKAGNAHLNAAFDSRLNTN